MTEQKKLRQMANNIRIVGTLKEINLEVKPNKNDASIMQIMGDIVVTVVDKKHNRIHEHKINLFAKHTSKLYKGYLTVKNQFKASDDIKSGEVADRVSVTGNIDENIYMGSDATLKQFNRNRGLFVNRVDEKALAKDPSLANDSAVAQLELVVTGIKAAADKEGIETGEYKIEGVTIGYENGVHNIHKMIVGEDLADVITENYEIGNTGKLTFAINNYAELAEVEEPDPFAGQEDGGFGVQVDISDGPATKYVNELRVIGGFPPYFDEKALDEDDIKLAKQIHALKVQEVKNAVPAAPPASKQQAGGFGTDAAADPFASGQGNTIDISDDDLPF